MFAWILPCTQCQMHLLYETKKTLCIKQTNTHTHTPSPSSPVKVYSFGCTRTDSNTFLYWSKSMLQGDVNWRPEFDGLVADGPTSCLLNTCIDQICV